MSSIDLKVRNSDVIPEIDVPAVFAGNAEASFAVGIIAVGADIVPGAEEIYRGYGILRAKVYAEQTRMIDPTLVHEDGTETDDDDKRSIHFAVVENIGLPTDEQRIQRVVGSLRLILKDKENPAPLPIEEFYPDVFADSPAELPSTEASRFICRHEDPRIQKWLKWPLFEGAVSYILAHGLERTFGVVEEPVEASLKKSGLVVTRIAEPRYVEEYGAANLGFEVDTSRLAQTMGLTAQDLRQMQAAEGKLTYPAPPQAVKAPKAVALVS